MKRDEIIRLLRSWEELKGDDNTPTPTLHHHNHTHTHTQPHFIHCLHHQDVDYAILSHHFQLQLQQEEEEEDEESSGYCGRSICRIEDFVGEIGEDEEEEEEEIICYGGRAIWRLEEEKKEKEKKEKKKKKEKEKKEKEKKEKKEKEKEKKEKKKEKEKKEKEKEKKEKEKEKEKEKKEKKKKKKEDEEESTGYGGRAIWWGIEGYVGEIGRIGGYDSSQRLLLVGEGDFSFSASLALAFGSACNMVATSLDSFEFLMKNYRKSMENLRELKARGCAVVHEMDATTMAHEPQLPAGKYDRIVFNFPLAGFFGRDVPRHEQIRKNQVLVSKFMKNARMMMKVDGEIHITHKAYGFFLEWDLQELGLRHGLYLVEELNFERADYDGYHTKYGFGGDRDFDSSGSKTYKFRLIPKSTYTLFGEWEGMGIPELSSHHFIIDW